ncbi:MAG: nuclear protein [Ilumatobacteraceae bacterium]|nr:nuclear protein [Ilumatobacteraceae bacterium]
MTSGTPVPPPSDVWVDDRVVVHASSIEGSGLFATADIRAGTTVLRLGGRLVTSAELDDLFAAAEHDPDPVYIDTFTIYEDAHVVLPPGTTAHFGNHSCDPSLWHSGPYEFVTRRDVSAGDELTLDYGTISGADGFMMECACGARMCRGRITSDHWRLPQLQQRYDGHWAPALQQRIGQAGVE